MNTDFNALRRFLSIALCLMILLGPSYRVLAQEVHGIITGDGVTTRSGPGVEYDKIGRLKSGDRVVVLDEQDRWLRVRDAEGREVWVFSRWVEQVMFEEEVKEEPPESVPDQEPAAEPEAMEVDVTPPDGSEAVEQPPLIIEEEKGGFPWLWVGLGVAAAGAVAVAAASGGDESSDDTTGSLVFDIEFP